jgi:CRISPR-associated protein Cas2
MNRGVRERIWKVIEKWYYGLCEEGSIVMTWSDNSTAVGQKVKVLGAPPVELINHEGIILTYRKITGSDRRDNKSIDCEKPD